MSSTTIIVSAQSFEATTAALPDAAKAHGFGVLHTYDLKGTMAKKGVEFGNNLWIFEVCNPYKAKHVLEENMIYNLALPCRVSVWEEGGEVKIGMMRPTVMLPLLGETPAVKAEAEEVEATLLNIMKDAATAPTAGAPLEDSK